MTDTRPKRIKLVFESNEHQRLLKREEETVSLHSGLVTINPVSRLESIVQKSVKK